MHPILCTFGPVTLYTYGAMLVLAFVLAAGGAVRAARRLPASQRALGPDEMLDFCCVSLLGGLIGGRLFYVGLHHELFLASPLEILALWQGGLVWYGGLFGGLVAAWLYTRARRLSLRGALDQVVPFLALGHAIGRVGCFLNGCCYGLPTPRWYGVRFPGHAQPLVPTQLLESAGLFVLAVILRGLQRQPWVAGRGRVVGAYLVGYAMLRVMMEGLRGDQPRGWMGLTLQQLVSLGLFAIGLVLLLRGQVPDTFQSGKGA